MSIVKLSEATSLALHSLAYIAGQNCENASVKSIAKALGASENHLHKVMQSLVKHGLVLSGRGPKGGFVLAKKPEKISLLDIYETMEGPLVKKDCPLDRSICPFGKDCMFCELFTDLTERFRKYFSTKTLVSYIH